MLYYEVMASLISQKCSSYRKLVILFVVIAAAVIVLALGGIVSVVCAIFLSKGIKPFMGDLTRTATLPTRP